jgi:hypothetical protein
MHHHPWREIRKRGDGVRLFFTQFEDGRVAATQGQHVYLDRRLLQVERRCAIQHEQIHLERGEDGCTDDQVKESVVRRVTARRLLSAHQLVPVAQWTQSIEEAADELWVTPEVLRDFMASLSPVERLMIECAVRAAGP